MSDNACPHCGADHWRISATLIQCASCEAEWGRVNEERDEAAVYGAMVAAQVMQLRRCDGRAPTDEDMGDFVEEARAVADMASEAARRNEV